MLKVPPKLLVIKNGQKSSDLFETLTQNSFRSYDLNEPKKSGLFRFFDGEKAKKHFSRKVNKVTNKNAPRKKSALFNQGLPSTTRNLSSLGASVHRKRAVFLEAVQAKIHSSAPIGLRFRHSVARRHFR